MLYIDAKREGEELRAGHVEYSVDVRMGIAREYISGQGWDIWKENSVAKYVRNCLRDLTRTEFVGMDRDRLEALIDHAGQGFDKWRSRRSR